MRRGSREAGSRALGLRDAREATSRICKDLGYRSRVHCTALDSLLRLQRAQQLARRRLSPRTRALICMLRTRVSSTSSSVILIVSIMIVSVVQSNSEKSHVIGSRLCVCVCVCVCVCIGLRSDACSSRFAVSIHTPIARRPPSPRARACALRTLSLRMHSTRNALWPAPRTDSEPIAAHKRQSPPPPPDCSTAAIVARRKPFLFPVPPPPPPPPPPCFEHSKWPSPLPVAQFCPLSYAVT